MLKIKETDRTDLRGKRLKARIADLVRAEIVEARFPLGAQLSEMSIAEELGVSRTPVREALMLLESEGLVEIRPQSGTYVFGPDRQEIIHVCEMRYILESAAIRLAIAAKDENLIEELRSNVKEASRVLKTDIEACHRLDTQFHRLLIEASGNPFLIQSYQGISNRLHALRQLLPLTKARLTNAVKQHREIIAAVESSDDTHAQPMLAEHIRNVCNMLLEKVDEIERGEHVQPVVQSRRRRGRAAQ